MLIHFNPFYSKRYSLSSLNNDSNMHYFCICSEEHELDVVSFMNGSLILNDTHKVFFDFTKSRKKAICGLTPGKYYYVYVFVANANGVSALSDTIKIEAN